MPQCPNTELRLICDFDKWYGIDPLNFECIWFNEGNCKPDEIAKLNANGRARCDIKSRFGFKV